MNYEYSTKPPMNYTSPRLLDTVNCTIAMFEELVGFFVSSGIPPKIRFDSQNGGNIHTKIWRRYKIFQKFTLL